MYLPKMRSTRLLSPALIAAATILVVSGVGTAFAQQSFPAPEGAPSHRATYRETTADESIDLVAREWQIEDGLFLESVSSVGDRHVVIVGEDLDSRAWIFQGNTASVVVRRRSGTVTVSGSIDGESVDGVIELREPRWVQSIERSLRRFVQAGEQGDRLRFSVIQPDNLSSRVLLARIMDDENILVDGETIAARRVRISLPGIGVLFWRSDYWYRRSDGLFVHSRVTRGPPGTPETVVTLIQEN